MSSRSPVCLILLLMHHGLSVTAVTRVSSIMGVYGLSNEEQCRRLCWYHLPCKSYTFHRLHEKDAADNCVLHSMQLDESPTFINGDTGIGRQTRKANGAGITNGCASRPCGEKEVCVPTFSASETKPYRCLHRAVFCPQPDPPGNGTVAYNSTKQGSTATMTCDPDYVISPRNASSESVCLSSSQWEEFQGSCIQAVYRDPIFPHFMLLPWTPSEGWNACVRGTFIKKERIAIHFRSETDGDSHLHILFRYFKNVVLSKSMENGRWSDESIEHGPMPLSPGDDFELSLHALKDTILLTVVNYGAETETEFLVPKRYVEQARYFYIGGVLAFKSGEGNSVQLSYINLVANCTSLGLQPGPLLQ